MERHDTHALSCTSSEDHSYLVDNNKNTSNKIISSENQFYTKEEEEENDWSKILINSFKDIKTTIALQDLSYNLNDTYNIKNKNYRDGN